MHAHKIALIRLHPHTHTVLLTLCTLSTALFLSLHTHTHTHNLSTLLYVYRPSTDVCIMNAANECCAAPQSNPRPQPQQSQKIIIKK